MGENLVLECPFDFEKIEIDFLREIVKKLLKNTKNLTENGIVSISDEDIFLADEIDKKSNPAGGNTLAILTQVIEAIETGFDNKKKLKDFGSMTHSYSKYLSFYVAEKKH